MTKLTAIITLFLFLISSKLEANLSTGIGYFDQEDFRVDNTINPLPFGTNIIPIISYRSERLVINGPMIRYNLAKGLFGAALHLNAYGYRYKAHELERRETSIHTGLSLRLAFLSFKYASDIYDKSNGNKFNFVIAHRFHFPPFTFIPRVGKEYLNEGISDYYFGVDKDEVGFFEEYQLDNTVNDIAGFTLIYSMSESQSLSYNYNYKKFDQVIFDSPTVRLKSFKSNALFWNFKI